MNQSLLEDLEIACMDAMRGDPAGPRLATRLKRVCEQVLTRGGARGVRVQVTSSRAGGTRVALLIPRPGSRVQQVVLNVGG